jgi:predicted nucleic acid-binding protein
MSDPYVDTNVIIRLLTGDDPQKQTEAAALFEAVEAGRVVIAAPDTVVADAVFVLSSPRLYHLPRHEVRALLASLVRMPNFRVENRRALLAALDIYATTNLDFGDAMIAASMQHAGAQVLYSYDADFDRVPGISRTSPGAPDSQ